MTIEVNTLPISAKAGHGRTALALLLWCAAGLSLGACSGGGAGPSTAATTPAPVGKPAPPASVEAALAKQAFTPYAGLDELADDGLASGESMSALAGACVSEAGYPGDAGDVPFGISSAAGLAFSPPFGAFGYLGAAEAAQYGFLPGPARSGVGAAVGLNPSAGASNADLPAAAQAAVDKCGTIVTNFTTAQENTSLASILSLGRTISAEVLADPDVKKVTSAWSKCMTADGYDYPDPDTAYHDELPPGTHLNPDAADDGLAPAQYQAQIATAESDAACTASTDLAGIYFAVQADYEQQVVDADQQKLNTAVQQFRAAYQKEISSLPTLLATTSAG